MLPSRTLLIGLTGLVAVAASGAAAEAGMTVTNETFSKRWATGPQDCFYWDDVLEWTASGSLAPGESFTFVPPVPTCQDAEAPVIMAWASWDASQLELSSVAPDNDGISDDLDQVGTPVSGTRRGNRATLCMFTKASRRYEYAITIRNVGAEVARSVQLSGAQYNGWPVFYYDRCVQADADDDGWNDSLEHVMGELTYYGYPRDGTNPYDTFMASNWLRAVGSAAADDEVDVYPPDLDDDGDVDAADVARVAAHVGEGTGVSIDTIGPNPGTPNYRYTQAQPWRRYDLDGDGWVTAGDTAIVQRYVGKSIPATEDTVAPAARIRAPADGATVRRGAYVTVGAYAGDNGLLDAVEIWVDGKRLCRLTEGSAVLPDNDAPHFRCGWSVPKRAAAHTIEVRAYDAAGNVGRHAVRVTAR